MNTKDLKIGDIIIINLKDGQGIPVPKRHPFVITHVEDKLISAIDARAIFAGFQLSSETSSYSQKILFALEKKLSDINDIVLTPNDLKTNSKKNSLLIINSLVLLGKDILPTDLQGAVSKEIVKKAFNTFKKLEKIGLAKVNIHNLPEVIKSKKQKDDSKEYII